MGARQFGARVKRLEDPALLTGRGRFVDDVKLPGTLEACFVRSPHAHARIRAIDTRAARALPGVHAVLTADDLPDAMAHAPIPMILPVLGIQAFRTQLCLARDEVRMMREQTIALVVADTRYLAEDAAARVAIDYEVLPAISDCRDALTLGAPPVHSDLPGNLASRIPMAYGDVDAAFATAAHVIAEEFWIHRGGGMSLETRAVLASYEPAGDLLTVWSSTQTPHLGRRVLADMLERNLETIRMIAPDVGGGFGPKAPFYPEEAVIPAAALRLGRPVKWIEDRREHFLTATQERDQYWSVALALDADGAILGFRGTMLHDTGAFVPWGIIMPYIAAVTVPGPYPSVPSYRLDMTVVLTNKIATTPVRGAGRPQAVFVMERLMDRAAREPGLDRAEAAPAQPDRAERNALCGRAHAFRDGKPLVYHGGDFPRGQATALALADYAGFGARREQALAQGRHIGIGIGNYVEGTGLGPFEGVTVRVLTNGKVAVATGATNQGQGQRNGFTLADRRRRSSAAASRTW